MKNIKALLYVLTVAGVFTSAKAQDNYYPQPAPPAAETISGGFGYFTANLGLVQPIGRFASARSISYGGYAMPGSAINISMGLKPQHSNFGLAVMVGNYTNPFNANKYAANIGGSDQAGSAVATVHDAYITSSVLAGPLYSIPVKKFSFDFRAMGGVLLCNFPEVGYAAYQYNAISGVSNYYNWDIAPSTGADLACDFGAGIRYNFANMALMLNADYIYSSQYYNTSERVTDPSDNKTYMDLNGNIKISALMYTLGFGYQIGR